MGPDASSTGWVLEYALADTTRRREARELRKLQDTLLRPALSAVPGVAELAPIGGAAEQVRVEIAPDALRSKALAFSDILRSLRTRLAADDVTSDDLGGFAVGSGVIPGPPVLLRDVARVRSTADMPVGITDLAGTPASVGAVVIARRGADIAAIGARVRAVLTERQRHLPTGVELVVVYDRSSLAARVEQTLLRALFEEVAVVALVILFLLAHGRSAIVPAITLPAVVLLTMAGMWAFGVPVSVMSLGGVAIALGMAVDTDVVALEASHRALEAAGARPDRQGQARARASAAATVPAILTSLAIAALTFLPVFAFSGETGRMVRPVAAAKTLVFAATAIVAVALAPALRELLVRGRVVPSSTIR